MAQAIFSSFISENILCNHIYFVFLYRNRTYIYDGEQEEWDW